MKDIIIKSKRIENIDKWVIQMKYITQVTCMLYKILILKL